MSARTPKQRPDALPEVLNVTPITSTVQLEGPKKAGRKPKPKLPAVPSLQMSDLEQQWFEFFIQSHRNEYPDMTDTDQIHLILAAISFINSLRVHQQELQSGQVISMARQHPANQMRAELDLLSFTRKARTAGKQSEDPALKDIKDKLLGLSA
jgi:hypothetical protein